MGKNAVDLSKLREEIDSRKKVNNRGTQESGSKPPKDTFLNELLTSVKTGQESRSTKILKMVEQKAAEKTGDKPANYSGGETMVDAIGKHSGGGSQTPVPPTPTGDEDRDHLLHEEYNRRMKEMFGEGAKELIPPKQQQTRTQPKQQINEEQLVDIVKKTINENFAPVVEQAMKEAIVEIYATERIKEVIQENENLIKNIVINTIRELQKKKKPQ